MTEDRFTVLEKQLRDRQPVSSTAEAGFVSLRWRLVMPLIALLLAAAMIVTYLVSATLTGAGQVTEASRMGLAARSAQDGIQQLYEQLANERMRIAFTEGLAAAVLAEDQQTLGRLLEAEAVAASLDGLLALDAAGVEVLHLRRSTAGGSLFLATSGIDRSGQALTQAVAPDQLAPVTGLLSSPEGFILYAAGPLSGPAGEVVGQVWVGMRLAGALESLRSSSLAQVALFDGSGQLMQSTFRADGEVYRSLTLTPEQVGQALAAADALPVQSLRVGSYPFQAVALPFAPGGGSPLGVLMVYLPSSVSYAAGLSGQLLSLLMASLAAAVVVTGYAGVGWVLVRVGRVSATMEALAAGDMGTRTRMRATDEIGRLGRRLDVYVDHMEQRQESLRNMLRRQRRENARLTSVLESMPDGIVVQDMDGRVLLMNENARELIGSQRAFRSGRLSELTAAVTDVLGPALAPGIYTLGAPQRVSLDGRVLSAQAAAIMTISGRQMGTLLVIRDITQQVQQEQAREALLLELSRDVQEPLLELVAMRSPADADPPLQRFAYEVMRNTIRLQRIVTQLRDLADLGPDQLDAAQFPLLVENLLNDLAVEWGPTAQACDLSLAVMVLHRDMHVLGDERRLRWALGNLLDNALKYTLPDGHITLIARQVGERAEVIVQDTGVGISAKDRPHLFTRFFRGTPQAPGGEVLRVPGMGQGLFIAKRVIEAHGGDITVESRQGKGTRVICRLPLTAPVMMALDQTPVALPKAVRSEPSSVSRRSSRQG